MEELLKTSCHAHVFAAIFMGIWILLFSKGLVKKYARSKLRKTLCILACYCLVSFWLYFFVYLSAYPVTLAYYECKNDITVEKVGVIDDIERQEKDRIDICIDDGMYSIVYSSQEPLYSFDDDLKIGNVVKITHGERSMFIFDLHRAD
ncbi:MAG: hypothetical protein IKM61_05330 [Eubacteriaceae bacterium]|nr:hypothetical protein [Eubacteriaceae bacterium]